MGSLSAGTLPFTIDSALLKELGERLVGRPYIALAELIKNSFDADAKKVQVTLDTGGDLISVRDDGHGMTFEEFDKYWMRIGSTHKRKARISKGLGRVMTGSKGIGRLAAQFLANDFEIITCSRDDATHRLTARIDWTGAVQTENLTEVKVNYEIETGGPFEQGTQLLMRHLESRWTTDEIRKLAQEIWWLQPPFRKLVSGSSGSDFTVEFESYKDMTDAFNRQMNAILDIWYARIVGRSEHGQVTMSVQWKDEKPITHRYTRENCRLVFTEFEIRVYHLIERQPEGIKVGEAREYLNKFGGVHIYDTGFRLPYYGDSRNDWLKIEFDHSHRLAKSSVIPGEIRQGVERALQFLPTLSRLLGVVNLSTSREPDLQPLVTRDRLKDSSTFDDLVWIVRYAIDFYALEEQRRTIQEREKTRETLKAKARRLDEVLEEYEAKIPKDVFKQLKKDVRLSLDLEKTEAELVADQMSFLGPLATAGMTSLAYQHETKTFLKKVEMASEEIAQIEKSITNEKLHKRLSELRENLSGWVKRARQTNMLFAYLGRPENLRNREKLHAASTIYDIWRQVSILMKGIDFEVDGVDKSLYLPVASYAEWSSIFQNVFLNAHNAMLMAKRKILSVSSRKRGRTCEILVQDTGYGFDIDKAEEFFEPFKREIKLTDDVKSAGYGGSGLGLAIVRLVGTNLGCTTTFVRPEGRFKTAFSLSWREAE